MRKSTKTNLLLVLAILVVLVLQYAYFSYLKDQRPKQTFHQEIYNVPKGHRL